MIHFARSMFHFKTENKYGLCKIKSNAFHNKDKAKQNRIITPPKNKLITNQYFEWELPRPPPHRKPMWGPCGKPTTNPI